MNALLLVAALLAPASAEEFARLTLWQVQESLAPEPPLYRSAAALTGKAAGGICPPGTTPCPVEATLRSSVDSSLGLGPLEGSFSVLQDKDPKRPLLSDLMVTASGTLRGDLDLSQSRSTATPTAFVSGRWESMGHTGRFTGKYDYPVPAKGHAVGAKCASGWVYVLATGPYCLRSSDISLGAPTTRVTLVFEKTK